MKRAIPFLGLVIVGGTLVVASMINAPPRAAEVNLTSAQSDYLEQCAGCHGLQGNTAPAPIPVLRDRVGYFMCTQEGRDYLLKLPNISHARVDDDALADMMNFVVFGLGGRTAPSDAPHFTTEDVARLRPYAMTGYEVQNTRKAVVEGLVKKCGAPVSLRIAYPGQGKPKRP